MPTYNSLISRTDAAAMVPEQVSQQMLGTLNAQSAALQLGTRIPVARNQVRFPVLSALPTAYWVSGDTGLKQTSEAAWSNKYLNIEEIATIVPVPEAVLDDAGFDIWGAIRPLMENAIVRAVDSAIFFGTSAPGSFPTNIVASAVSAGNVVARGTNNAAAGGLAQDVSDTFATLEADGYRPTGAVGNITLRGRLRSVRSTTGDPLQGQVTQDSVFGTNVQYPMEGLWPTGVNAVELVVGAYNNLVIGVRRDMTYKLLDQATITDGSGAVIFNLAQQDMVALRLVFRMGWEVSNPIQYQQPTESARYPFSVLRSPAS